MVDPINNRGYYEYRRVNTKTETGLENGEKFSLDYEHTETESDKDGKEKTKVEADGVIAEFSSQSQSQYGGIGSGKKTAADAEETVDFGRAAEQVKGFIGELVRTITAFFHNVKSALIDFWNSDSGAAAADGEAEAESPEQVIDVTELSQEINGEDGINNGINTIEVEGVIERPADRKPPEMKDRKAEAEAYLENEEKMNRYVKNSDLLTYYDRSGRIVQMNGSDKNRILHGDSRTSRGV